MIISLGQICNNGVNQKNQKIQGLSPKSMLPKNQKMGKTPTKMWMTHHMIRSWVWSLKIFPGIKCNVAGLKTGLWHGLTLGYNWAKTWFHFQDIKLIWLSLNYSHSLASNLPVVALCIEHQYPKNVHLIYSKLMLLLNISDNNLMSGILTVA